MSVLLPVCQQASFALVKVHRSMTRVPIVLDTEINSLNKDWMSHNQVIFHLADTIVDKNSQFIPKNTVIKGHIIRQHASKRFGCPALAFIQLDEIDLPDNKPVMIPKEMQRNTRLMVEPERHKSFKHFVLENVFLGNASMLVSGPIAIAGKMGVGAFTVLDMAAGAGIGAVYGVKEKQTTVLLNPDLTPQSEGKDHRFWHVANTVYEAVSPIPPVWQLFGKASNFNYQPGTIVLLPVKTKCLQTIERLSPPIYTHDVNAKIAQKSN